MLRKQIRIPAVAIAITIASGTVVVRLGSREEPSRAGEPYRVPVIAIVQPLPGGAIPQDEPVVVIRYQSGVSDDPLDLASFRITVDGSDRTAAFHTSDVSAWGAISPRSRRGGDTLITPGPHVVTARICSSRGVCADVSSALTVVAPAVSSSSRTGDPPAPSRAARARSRT